MASSRCMAFPYFRILEASISKTTMLSSIVKFFENSSILIFMLSTMRFVFCISCFIYRPLDSNGSIWFKHFRKVSPSSLCYIFLNQSSCVPISQFSEEVLWIYLRPPPYTHYEGIWSTDKRWSRWVEIWKCNYSLSICWANLNQLLLVRSNFTLSKSSLLAFAFLSCWIIIKPFRAILKAPFASAFSGKLFGHELLL